MSAVFADAGRHGEGPLARLMAEASTLEQASRLQEAEALLRQALQVAPEHPHAIHMLGIVAFRSGNEEEACRLMERSIALSPNTGLYYRNICAIYRALGRLEAGRAAGLRAVSLTPDDPHAHANLAIIHYDLLELDEAFACCERALALKPIIPKRILKKRKFCFCAETMRPVGKNTNGAFNCRRPQACCRRPNFRNGAAHRLRKGSFCWWPIKALAT